MSKLTSEDDVTSHQTLHLNRVESIESHRNSGTLTSFFSKYDSEVLLSNHDIYRLGVTQFYQLISDVKQQRNFGIHQTAIFFYGYTSGIILLLIGIILLIFGILLYLDGLHTAEIILPYHEVDETILLTLSEQQYPKWDVKKTVFVYFLIHPFFTTFRGYAFSRPAEIFGPYSCTRYNTFKSLKSIRSLDTFSNNLNFNLMDEESYIFPCGLTSFSIFLDTITIERDDLSQTKLNIEKSRFNKDYKYIIYATKVRPNNLKVSDDWIIPTSEQYRTWTQISTGNIRKLPYGFIQEGLPFGKYIIRLKENKWPAKNWDCTKSIVFEQLGYFGSYQEILPIIFQACGIVTIIVSILYMVLIKANIKIKTESSKILKNIYKLSKVVGLN